MKALITKALQRVVLCASCLIVASCTVPGSYFGANESHQKVDVGGKWLAPRIVSINAELLSHPQYLTLEDLGDVFYQYRVGPADVLNIVVWDHPELSSPMMNVSGTNMTSAVLSLSSQDAGAQSGFLVDDRGYLFFPYAGQMRVEHLNVNEIRLLLQQRLSHYIHNPQVTVRVTGFRSKQVYVIGQINNPGVVSLNDKPLTIMSAISLAGGLNQQDADPSHIYIIRGPAENPLIFVLDARSPQALLIAERFRLHSRDIVYVPATGISRWNRVVNAILPTVQTVWFTKSVVQAGQ